MTRKRAKPEKTAPRQLATNAPAKLEMARAVLMPPNLAANAIGSLGMVNTEGDTFDVPALTEALMEQAACH